MKLAIMQPYFFPYLGYFQLIHAVDKFILYDDLTFIKDAWMNRNRIMIKNQKPAHIVVPLEKKSSNKKIKDIKIANTHDWKSTILNSIHLNYRKAQFFDEIYPIIERIIQKDYTTLSSLNASSIKTIVEHLGIQTDFSIYPDYSFLEKNLERDEFITLFPHLQLKSPKRKVVRVLEIAKAEEAKTFINPIGGVELYSKNEFERNNLQLYFLKMKTIEYPQFSKEFVSSLSIIDVLMHNGWDTTSNLLDSYDLK